MPIQPSRSRWLAPAFAAVALASGVGLRADKSAGGRPPDDAVVLRDAVTIARDRHGIPHVRAKNEQGAWYGLGYAHAQDRLWQMEYQRRVGNGRLAEILGSSFLGSDRFFRTVGTHRAAASAWKLFPSAGRAALEAYAAGVNEYIGSRQPHQLPVEFRIYGFSPEPWRPEDTIVWMKTLAWGVGRNWDGELMRTRLAQRLGAAKAGELLPLFMSKDPQIMSHAEGASASTESALRGSLAAKGVALPAIPAEQADALITLHLTLRNQLGIGGEQVGSNNWVLSGARTTTGKPILANDPHLDSQVPGNWYLAHVSGGGLDAIGATLPGIPGVVIGHNGQIAWGITNTGTDVEDLFIEQISDGQVATPRGLEPLVVIAETIRVKGQPDVTIDVRATDHGPLISDVVAPGGAALALRWAGLDERDNSIAGFLRMNRARNWEEFTGAMRDVHVPMQNFVYADGDGNIGYLAPGALPIRAKGEGLVPVPGWTGEYDWKGYVPFDELPSELNPKRGYIVTANNRISSTYPHFVGNFAPYYRAGRIVELISGKARHSLADVAAMQADVTSTHAREVLPRLLEVPPVDERSARALTMLQEWDGALDGASPQAAIFEAWLTYAPAALLADEVGDAWSSYVGLNYVSDIATANVINDPTSPWCDNVATPGIETCDVTLGAALAAGLAAMAKMQGTEDVHRWRWDRAHHAVFPHHPLDASDALRRFFNRAIATGGDQFTINIGAPVSGTFEQRHVNDYRQIVDLGRIARSRFIVAPGQSGDVFSKHYDDLLERWKRVQYVPMQLAPLPDVDAADPIVLRTH